MRNKISYWFVLGMAVWVFIILLRKYDVFIPVISNHFTDLITIPMYAYLIEYLMNAVLGQPWKPDFKFILSSTIYLSLLFEVVGPMLSERFTGDLLDVGAYCIGGIIYYFLRLRSLNFFKSDEI
ncbi:hypothetical protein CLU96_4236 [Chryseobacterium sp. 52]|uniref:hypothetical protein n=1 Tax=Chryseobacterium sp. 52 TaxID=2035213 RepID=UPI000C17D1D9|nr:hypothetical protein [Chryseobacterium sp. 52]PIF47187.1 hypothetical protein CLU96_4236 [Chryseobacterium sp. 52]